MKYRGICFVALLMSIMMPSRAQESMPMPPHNRKPVGAMLTLGGEDKGKTAAHEMEKPGIVRTYYIAADEVDWDYTPRGRNLAGLPHVEAAENEADGGASHRAYHKAIYREYTD